MYKRTAALEAGTLFEQKYRVVRLIGEGSMGAVYEAENVRIGRRVAVKILHGDVSGSPEVGARFEREAQVAGKIDNDHVVEILDLGTLSDGRKYIVMEYLAGESLRDRLSRVERLSSLEVFGIFRQILTALDAAHRAGIVHRDLKPDNVILLTRKVGRADFVKLIDFGIARFMMAAMRMTMSGAFMGTPLYSSPEQAAGKALDHRSDLYSVGVMMYEAASGRLPHNDQDMVALLVSITTTDAPPLSEVVAGVDPELSSIVAKAMTRDEAGRFQNAREFIEALDGWADLRLSILPIRPSLAGPIAGPPSAYVTDAIPVPVPTYVPPKRDSGLPPAAPLPAGYSVPPPALAQAEAFSAPPRPSSADGFGPGAYPFTSEEQRLTPEPLGPLPPGSSTAAKNWTQSHPGPTGTLRIPAVWLLAGAGLIGLFGIVVVVLVATRMLLAAGTTQDPRASTPPPKAQVVDAAARAHDPGVGAGPASGAASVGILPSASASATGVVTGPAAEPEPQERVPVHEGRPPHSSPTPQKPPGHPVSSRPAAEPRLPAAPSRPPPSEWDNPGREFGY